MITLVELLNQLKTVIESESAYTRLVTICTYENLLVRVSENKNEYPHVFIVYDLRQVTVGEWSTTLPLTVVIADKLRANKDNEIYVHSNTLSLGVDICKILRNWARDNGLDGVDNVALDVWTEDEADSLLGGTKLDFTLTTNIGGYCDYIQE
ncbi:MAG: hypothetical protein ACYTBJ_22815 [Planctomycetota bacterium]|jgi:hypothetical protein